jgi:hypothetical protein
LQLLEVLVRTCRLKKESNHKKLLLQLLLLQEPRFKQRREQLLRQHQHPLHLALLPVQAEMLERH